MSVVCVLGCQSSSDALQRRARKACEIFFAREATTILACGGRAWDGVVEADALAALLREGGVPAEAIVRERCSLDTRDNARFAAAMLGRRGIRDVIIVTCTWHLPRALHLFRAAGFSVEGAGAAPPPATLGERTYRWLREGVSSLHERTRRMRLS